MVIRFARCRILSLFLPPLTCYISIAILVLEVFKISKVQYLETLNGYHYKFRPSSFQRASLPPHFSFVSLVKKGSKGRDGHWTILLYLHRGLHRNGYKFLFQFPLFSELSASTERVRVPNECGFTWKRNRDFPGRRAFLQGKASSPSSPTSNSNGPKTHSKLQRSP